jgi:hypothetical protein
MSTLINKFYFAADGCFENTGFENRDGKMICKFRFHGTAIIKLASKQFIPQTYGVPPAPYSDLNDTLHCGSENSTVANVWMEGEFEIQLSSVFKVKSIIIKSYVIHFIRLIISQIF